MIWSEGYFNESKCMRIVSDIGLGFVYREQVNFNINTFSKNSIELFQTLSCKGACIEC